MVPPPTAATISPQPTTLPPGLDSPAHSIANLNLGSTKQKPVKAQRGRFDPKLPGAPTTSSGVISDVIEKGFDKDNYKYKNLLPHFPDYKWEPLVEEEYNDAALRADTSFKNLWEFVSEIEHLTPKFGTVLYGIDLNKLNDAAKDELALLIAQRGAVFVRDQDDFDIKNQLELGRHWGTLHRHATTSLPQGSTEDEDLLNVHVVYAAPERVTSLAFSQTYQWHSDVTYEKQPPSYTSLKLLEGPEHGGGDTLWINQRGIYDSLSPQLQNYLSQLSATHSAVEQAEGARRSGNPVRREPVVSQHPLVRTNPVTGHNAVFVNPGFTRKIVGVPKSESESILNHLFQEIATNVTNTVRWKWQKGDIAFWDNRSTSHSASYGFYPHPRHAVRVTVQAETPYFDKNGKSQQDELDKEFGRTFLHKDVANPPVYND